jgi:hypothetical protein
MPLRSGSQAIFAAPCVDGQAGNATMHSHHAGDGYVVAGRGEGSDRPEPDDERIANPAPLMVRQWVRIGRSPARLALATTPSTVGFVGGEAGVERAGNAATQPARCRSATAA